MQKEVADRLAAEPGTKAYGALTIAVQYRMAAEMAWSFPGQFSCRHRMSILQSWNWRHCHRGHVPFDEAAFSRSLKRALRTVGKICGIICKAYLVNNLRRRRPFNRLLISRRLIPRFVPNGWRSMNLLHWRMRYIRLTYFKLSMLIKWLHIRKPCDIILTFLWKASIVSFMRRILNANFTSCN